jgi:hypothetical protein
MENVRKKRKNKSLQRHGGENPKAQKWVLEESGNVGS